jgi:hypothetical protein
MRGALHLQRRVIELFVSGLDVQEDLQRRAVELTMIWIDGYVQTLDRLRSALDSKPSPGGAVGMGGLQRHGPPPR